MRRRSVFAIAATTGLVAATTAIGAGMLSAPAHAQQSPFWVNPSSQVVQWVAANPGDPRAGLINDRIATVPQGTWFTAHNPGSVGSDVSSVVNASGSQIPILVAYNVPNRDCDQFSAGGAPNHAEYRAWVDGFASGLGNSEVFIVLEPDVLPLMSTCMSAAEQAETQDSMAYAVNAFKSANSQARVYMDIGHSNWLGVSDAAGRLIGAGVTNSDGISVNTSNYNHTQDEIGFASAVLDAIGDPSLGFVVDTSRNGNGPLGSEWCDPEGRAVGQEPTLNVNHPQGDALLWVKLPGEADGCAGAAGQFIPDLAFELAENAGPVSPSPTDSPTPTQSPTESPSPTDSPTPTDPAGECHVDFSLDQWDSGFVAQVTITNNGAAWSSWELSATVPSGVSLVNGWNAGWDQTGTTLTANNEAWNGSVNTGQSVDAGFQASHGGNVGFSDVTVNGVACST